MPPPEVKRDNTDVSGDGLIDMTLSLPIPPLTAVDMAKLCMHHFDVQTFATMQVKVAVFHQLTMGVEATHRYRVGVLSRMKRRAKELQETERVTKSATHPCEDYLGR